MAVIKTIKYGSGEVRIHDDYCKDKTPEQIQEIVQNVSRIVMRFYRQQEAEGKMNREA